MIDKHAAGPGHDALALESLSQPVAQGDLAPGPVDAVVTNHAGKHPVIPDARLEPIAIPFLLDRGADERARIADRTGPVHPRQPRPQMGAVLVSESEQVGGVGLGQEPELDVVLDEVMESCLGVGHR
jgi:hypothetical protein